MIELSFATDKRYDLVDITSDVERKVEGSGVDSGIACIFTPHSTAAVLITENEKGLASDWMDFFKETVSEREFSHNKIDGNADSHLLSGLIGQGKVLIIEKGAIILGTWQRVFLAEFDGPRKDRKILVKIVS